MREEPEGPQEPEREEDIKVRVFKRRTGTRGRRNAWRLRAYHPSDPSKILWERKARGKTKRDALKEAILIEKGLEKKRPARSRVEQSSHRKTWREAAEDYEDQVLLGHSLTCEAQFKQVRLALEETDLEWIDDFSHDHVFRVESRWKQRGLAPATISSYLRSLRAFLNWTDEVGWWHDGRRPPRIRAESTAARSRAITYEEYLRMREHAGTNWWVLDVLWLGNLRIGELHRVTWEWPGPIWMDLEHERWRVGDTKGKVGKYRVFPMPPDFADWIREHWIRNSGSRYVFPRTDYSQIVSRVGRRANVVTGEYHDGRPKYASAHDFRRALAHRWQPVLTPAELMKLMRHSSFSTTLQYYLDVGADEVSGKMRRALSRSSETSGKTNDSTTGVPRTPKNESSLDL